LDRSNGGDNFSNNGDSLSHFSSSHTFPSLEARNTGQAALDFMAIDRTSDLSAGGGALAVAWALLLGDRHGIGIGGT
jgi:hypothetical protein